MDAVSILDSAASGLDAGSVRSVCTDTVEFVTPASSHLVVRGPADVEVLFGVLFSVFDRVECRATFGAGDQRVLILDCRFGRFSLTDAMHLTLDDTGRVTRFEPHLRPWADSSIFILLVAARLCLHPGLLARSMNRRRPTGR